MANRMDAVAVRKYNDKNTGEEKSSYTNIGVAWPFKDKEGFTLRLNAIPAPNDGEYTILLFPPKPKDGQQQSYGQASGGFVGQGGIDDEIPF